MSQLSSRTRALLRPIARLAVIALVLFNANCDSDSDESEDPCKPDDADGIAGGTSSFEVSVSDTDFQPKILTVQNMEKVTLVLKNTGTKSHGFSIDCLPTPNDRGCAQESCMPGAATIAPIAPGQTATVVFDVPAVEGLYTWRSTEAGDVQTGQFIVQ